MSLCSPYHTSVTISFTTVRQGLLRAFQTQVFNLYFQHRSASLKVVTGDGNLFADVMMVFLDSVKTCDTTATVLDAHEATPKCDSSGNEVKDSLDIIEEIDSSGQCKIIIII